MGKGEHPAANSLTQSIQELRGSVTQLSVAVIELVTIIRDLQDLVDPPAELLEAMTGGDYKARRQH